MMSVFGAYRPRSSTSDDLDSVQDSAVAQNSAHLAEF